MNNPFDAETGPFVVLVNDEGQHSLWPAFLKAPSGWTTALTAAPREEALAWVEANWTDMRPRSLAAELSVAGRGRADTDASTPGS